MLRFLRRAASLCNRTFGLSLTETHLYRITTSSKWAATNPCTIDLKWEMLVPEKVNSLSEIGPFDVNEGLKRLQQDDYLCYLAYSRQQLTHYSWVQRSGIHPITEAGISVPVESGDFWIFHCVTAEWARGQGIYAATLERIVGEHFKAGYQTAWIYTDRKNIASQKGIRRAGFSLAGTQNALRFGSRYYGLRSPSVRSLRPITTRQSTNR